MQNFPKELQLFFLDEDGRSDDPRCRPVHFAMSGQPSEHLTVLGSASLEGRSRVIRSRAVLKTSHVNPSVASQNMTEPISSEGLVAAKQEVC